MKKKTYMLDLVGKEINRFIDEDEYLCEIIEELREEAGASFDAINVFEISARKDKSDDDEPTICVYLNGECDSDEYERFMGYVDWLKTYSGYKFSFVVESGD